MELKIKCAHEAGSAAVRERVSDYYPLTKDELRRLLEVAAAHQTGTPKRARRLGGRILRRSKRQPWQLTSILQVRLTQAISGMTCPRPYISNPEVARRMAAMDSLYVETLQRDPCLLPDMVEEFYKLLEPEGDRSGAT